MTGMAISCIINALTCNFCGTKTLNPKRAPTGTLRLSGRVSLLLCHWNIYIGCYKSEWQILETTWKPQEIFYPSLIYGNSWCQKKKKRMNSEFRANAQYLLMWSGHCYLKLTNYCFVDYINWITSRARYKTDKHIFQLACPVKIKQLSSKC